MSKFRRNLENKWMKKLKRTLCVARDRTRSIVRIASMSRTYHPSCHRRERERKRENQPISQDLSPPYLDLPACAPSSSVHSLEETSVWNSKQKESERERSEDCRKLFFFLFYCCISILLFSFFFCIIHVVWIYTNIFMDCVWKFLAFFSPVQLKNYIGLFEKFGGEIKKMFALNFLFAFSSRHHCGAECLLDHEATEGRTRCSRVPTRGSNGSSATEKLPNKHFYMSSNLTINCFLAENQLREVSKVWMKIQRTVKLVGIWAAILVAIFLWGIVDEPIDSKK